MTMTMGPSPAVLAFLFFGCALLALMAATNRRQRRAAGAGVLLMSILGVPYLAAGGGSLIAKGRPSLTSFVYWQDDPVNFTEVTAANTGPRYLPLITASSSAPPSGMTYSGDTFYADTANRTYSGIVFNDFVSVRAADVTFQDCIFRGGAAGTTERALVMCTSANCVRARFLFCKMRPTNPTEYLNGIQGHHVYAYRCDISGTVDPFRAQDPANPSGTLSFWADCCYGHDWYYQSPSVVQQNSDNQTHNDGIQVSNGLDILVSGCALHGFCDTTISSPAQPSTTKIANHNGKGTGRNVLACFQVTCNAGPVGNLRFICNDLYGGTVKFQFSQKGRGAMTGVECRSNRVADDGTRDNFALIDQSTLNAMVAAGGISGNVWKSGPRAGQPIGVSTTGFAGRTDT